GPSARMRLSFESPQGSKTSLSFRDLFPESREPLHSLRLSMSHKWKSRCRPRRRTARSVDSPTLPLVGRDLIRAPVHSQPEPRTRLGRLLDPGSSARMTPWRGSRHAHPKTEKAAPEDRLPVRGSGETPIASSVD